jgi:heparanase 1
VSSFGYVDTLGSLARLNHSVLARQTLVGGNYELLRCSSGQANGSKGNAPEAGAGCDFEPHPDYWVALLWRRLMGATVLPAPQLTAVDATAASSAGGSASSASSSASAASTAGLRLHAHCTAGASNGSVTVAFSNMDEAVSYRLNMDTGAFGAGGRVEYRLAPANATRGDSTGINTRRLTLNGRALEVGDSTELPSLAGAAVAGGAPMVVAPVSIGWMVFPQAGAAECMRQLV